MRLSPWLAGAVTMPLVVVGTLVARSEASEANWLADVCRAASEAATVVEGTVASIDSAIPSDSTGVEAGLIRTTLKLTSQPGVAPVNFIVPGGTSGARRQVIGGGDILSHVKTGSTVLAMTSSTRDPLQPSGQMWIQIVGDNGQKYGVRADQVDEALAELAPQTSGSPRRLVQRPGGTAPTNAGKRIEVPGGGAVLSWKSQPGQGPSDTYRAQTWDRVSTQAKHCARGGGQ